MEKELQINDLRIGNWIHHKFSEPNFIVSEINAFSENNTVNGIALCDCEPILITEQWLVDLGFEKDDVLNYRWYLEDWLAYDLDDNFIRISDTWEFGKRKYVHELQNLFFALTGRELELKTKNL